MKRSGVSNAFGTLAGVLLLLHSAAAQEQRPSYYPEKPKDDKAVYLVKDIFPVHADGVGDDSAAIQQAIDKVEGQGAAGPNCAGAPASFSSPRGGTGYPKPFTCGAASG